MATGSNRPKSGPSAPLGRRAAPVRPKPRLACALRRAGGSRRRKCRSDLPAKRGLLTRSPCFALPPRPSDNAFLAVADPAALQAAADRLSPDIIRLELGLWRFGADRIVDEADPALIFLARDELNEPDDLVASSPRQKRLASCCRAPWLLPGDHPFPPGGPLYPILLNCAFCSSLSDA